MMTPDTMNPLTAMVFFDTRATSALNQTRAAWMALGDLMSGAPVMPAQLEEATSAYQRTLMALGLEALRTSYLNPPAPTPPPRPIEPPAAPLAQPVEAPAVRRAPAPAMPAPVKPVAVKPTALTRVDPAALEELRERLNGTAQWEQERESPAMLEARRLDLEVRALCEAGVQGWRQGQGALDKIGALVANPRAWDILNSADRVELLSALAAMVRHVNEVPLPAEQRAARSEQVKRALAGIRSARRADVDAFVHGLATAHTAQRGAWWDDARQQLGLLREDKPTKAKKPAQAACPVAAPTVEAEEAPRENPCPHVAGQRWAVVGGDRRNERADQLKELLGLTELDWIDTAPGKQQHVNNVIKRMRNATLDAVVIIKSFTNHSATIKLREASKKCQAKLIWVDAGYGEQQLIAAIDRYAPAKD
jgi:hypothetical protein